MTIGRAKRPLTDLLLTPASICVVGADTLDGAHVLANLHTGGFGGPIWSVPGTSATVGGLPGVPDLAVIAAGGEQAAADLAALGAHGGTAAVVTGQIADLATVARRAGVRVLGPNSFGLAVPKLGLNASLSHMAVPPGHVALVTQSAALARAVVDWAEPNGVGFSHVVGIGGNADVGFDAILDFLARDADTRLILLDIRRVRERRAFISAARAASRLRPVVAIRPGGLLLDPTGRSDGVFAAALNRAGVFVADRMEAFLAAAETLSRARKLHGEALAVVTNAIGPGRLAADAAVRAGIRLATLPGTAAGLPADLTSGLIYTGSAETGDVAAIASALGAVPGVGGVLVLLAPTKAGDTAAVDALIAAARTAPLPVLSCVMGETTGAAHRRRIAQAGLPAFATPEQAVQGFGHLLRDRAARLAARELPPGRVLAIDPDQDGAHRILAGARAAGRLRLTPEESVALLGCYGLAAGRAGGEAASLRAFDDPSFGPALMLCAGPAGTAGYGLPPLNLPLAQAMAGRAGVAGPLVAAAANVLVRVSQMLVDLPDIEGADIWRLTLGADGHCGIGEAAIVLRAAGDSAHLAISPYPEQLTESWSSRGQDFVIRAIRPEDAAAHAALVARIPSEDLRYRFFTSVRQIAPEQMVRLTQIDYDREMAFIAVRATDQASVGVARLVCEAAGGPGEFAILVEPDSKGLGLARHLMDRLIGWARARGVPAIVGQVLADNHPMLGFVHHLGFSAERSAEEPDVVHVTLGLAAK